MICGGIKIVLPSTIAVSIAQINVFMGGSYTIEPNTALPGNVKEHVGEPEQAELHWEGED